jgi:hypothetical protein
MIPNEIRANFDITLTLEGYASQVASGYTPKLILGGAASLIKDGTVVGDDIVFALIAADTAAFTTGQYWYQVVSDQDAGAGRAFILDGSVLVKATISGSGAYDGRSTAKQILDAIDATILGKATRDQQSYVIQSGSGSRSLSRIPLPDLQEIRKVYAAIVAGEIRDATESPLFKRHPFKFVINR